MALKNYRVKKGCYGYEEWYYLYWYINKKLFGGALPDAVLTFNCGENLDYSAVQDAVWIEKGMLVPSIEFNMYFVRFYSLREIFHLMTHEMIHIKLLGGEMNGPGGSHGEMMFREFERLGIAEECKKEKEGTRWGELVEGGAAEKAFQKLRGKGFALPLQYVFKEEEGIVLRFLDEEWMKNLRDGIMRYMGMYYSAREIARFRSDDNKTWVAVKMEISDETADLQIAQTVLLKICAEWESVKYINTAHIERDIREMARICGVKYGEKYREVMAKTFEKARRLYCKQAAAREKKAPALKNGKILEKIINMALEGGKKIPAVYLNVKRKKMPLWGGKRNEW